MFGVKDGILDCVWFWGMGDLLGIFFGGFDFIGFG